MDSLPIFGERLLLARRRRKMSQDGLARVSGIAASDISKMERQKLMPTAPRIRKLAEALGVSADYLLGLADDDEEPAA